MCGIGLLLSYTADNSNPLHFNKEWNDLLSTTLSSRGPDLSRRACHYEFNSSRSASLTLHGSVLHMRGVRARAQPLVFSLSPPIDDGIGDCCVHTASAVANQCDYNPINADQCALCWNGECYTFSAIEHNKNERDSSCDDIKFEAMIELVADEDTGASSTFDAFAMCCSQDANHSTTNMCQSDTILVKNLLQQSISKTRQYYDDKNGTYDLVSFEHKTVAETMSRIHGEYSFLLFVPPASSSLECFTSKQQGQQSNGYVYYGRDVLGRRSLLVNRSVDGVVVISSVATPALLTKEQSIEYAVGSKRGDTYNFEIGWEELPPGIVYRLDVSTGEVASVTIPRIINKDVQKLLSSVNPKTSHVETANEMGLNSQSTMTETAYENAAYYLLHLLDKSIQRRVMHAPHPKSQCTSDASVAVLFSGGIDSVILAALSHRHIPPDRPIDLINVSFYDESDSTSTVVSPDRFAGLHSYLEMTSKWPQRKWKFIAVDVSYQEVLEVESKVLRLICPLDSTMDFNIAVAFWFAGRGRGRVVSQKEADELLSGLGHQAMAHKQGSSQEPLLRFAKSNNPNDKDSNDKSPSPSRSKKRPICIREECTRPAPENGCVFHACKFCCAKLQSPISKFLGCRAQICPAHNYGTAVTRNGRKNAEKNTSLTKLKSYDKDSFINDKISSAAKILLSGVGADEQMAGYGRHRTTFQRGGYEELKDELQMEVRRLWTRNLGRDNRCLSDCGREARFPYLDEDVVEYLESLPLELKCNLSLPQGEGDKLILRKVARMIGVNECSVLVKRAIQFGSRIAKVSDKNRFGSQRQATGAAKHIRG